MFEKITEADIAKRGVAAVSTTPTRRTPFGESAMNAEQLKERFDTLPRHIADRLNEIFSGIPDGALVDVLKLKHGEEIVSLAELARGLLDGNVENIQVKTIYETLSLAVLGARVVEMYNGLSSGELASKLKLSKEVSLSDFYLDEKRLVEKDYEAIANIVITKLPDNREVAY